MPRDGIVSMPFFARSSTVRPAGEKPLEFNP
jgi:hypothetical protein